MPKIIFPILSDIHFEAVNPIISRSTAIANAIVSVDPKATTYIVLLPGDIAFAGVIADYEIAKSFLTALKIRIQDRCPGADVSFVSIPGNHDCQLPKPAIANRKAKVEAAIPTLSETKPDEYFIDDVLGAQSEYWKFALAETVSMANSQGTRLLETVYLKIYEKTLQINLINTALLSQYEEQKGGLYVPATYIGGRLTSSKDQTLVVTMLHHWTGWIEPTNFNSVRQVLGSSTDIVVTGHQHFSFSSEQTFEDGAELTFIESPALYDKKFPTSSAFRVLEVDLEKLEMAKHHFKWKQDIYRPQTEISEARWFPIPINRLARENYRLAPKFLDFLNDPGVAYVHSARENIKLSELFVYPDLRRKQSSTGEKPQVVRGSKVLAQTAELKLSLIQGSALSGKTALAKTLFLDLSAKRSRICVFIDGKNVQDIDGPGFRKLITRALKEQYDEPDVDKFFQLELKQRAIIIDNWHLARLSDKQRFSIYSWLDSFAANSILMVDSMFQINAIASTNAPNVQPEVTLPNFTELTILGLGYVSRGHLVANWQRLRKESIFDPPETSRDAKESEDIVAHRLTKDSLPPYAFFILCMLQADENRSLESIEGGSFGHLYEVLVTTALHKGRPIDGQLNKKFALLEEIAMELWKKGCICLSREEIDMLAETFRRHHLLTLPITELLHDFIDTRVLVESEGHYSFAYEHFYLYFVARYIRNHIDDQGHTLQGAVDNMVDNISSSQNSTIIMFLIYFAKNRRGIVDRLVKNAALIYAEVEPAKLEDDAKRFVSAKPESFFAEELDEDPNIAENRKSVRERQDKQEEEHAESKPQNLHLEAFTYSDNLSDVKKLHLAEKNIEVLGQVVRNFTTNLSGEDKVAVIRTVYLIGLRSMRRLLDVLSVGMELLIEKPEEQGIEFREAASAAKNVMLMLATVVSAHFCRQISRSVGTSDMELAYAATLKEIDMTTAVRLVDLTIRMEHSETFPESIVEDLYKSLDKNPFARFLCVLLVMAHFYLYKVKPLTRRRIFTLFKLNVKKLEASLAQSSPLSEATGHLDS